MSVQRPFAPSFSTANPYARPIGGNFGQPSIRVEYRETPPHPRNKPTGKHGFLKTLFYGGATIGIGIFALKKFSPGNYAKLAEAAGKYTPASAQEFKNYLTTQASNLKNSGLAESAISKAKPLTDGVKNLWKRLVG